MNNESNQIGPDISFFVPCYNEEQNIAKTLGKIISSVNKTPLSYEIIVVNDKSEDQTKDAILEFIKMNPGLPIRMQDNKVNLGLGRNNIDIAFMAQGNHYMLVNGDNAEPEETLDAILAEVGKADMVIPFLGNRDNRSSFRIFTSKVFTFLINIISGYKIKYFNGPIVHKRYNVMRWSPDTHGFGYQAEIVVKVLDEKGTFVHVQISNNDREEGDSKAFTIKNILSVGHSILQIFLRRLRALLFYRTP